MSKFALTRGHDIYKYETRGTTTKLEDGMIVYEHLQSQVGVHFTNKLPNSIKNALTPKALKTCLKYKTKRTQIGQQVMMFDVGDCSKGVQRCAMP